VMFPGAGGSWAMPATPAAMTTASPVKNERMNLPLLMNGQITARVRSRGCKVRGLP
jgi:hypothetical protein